MATITNAGPCPVAIVSNVQRKLAETDRRREERRGGLRGLFAPSTYRRGEGVVDARWFSDCDVATRSCSGRLLGRWIIVSSGLKPLEEDFTPAPPPVPGSEEDYEQRHSIYDPMHTLVVNFAITAQADRCVVHEVDLDGNVKLSAYELPHGISSESFGPMIGEPLQAHFDRDAWDSCVPEQYQLARGKLGQNASSQT